MIDANPGDRMKTRQQTIGILLQGRHLLSILLMALAMMLQAGIAMGVTNYTYYDKVGEELDATNTGLIEEHAVKRVSSTGITEYPVKIVNSFVGNLGVLVTEEAGNPMPEVGLHWVTKDDPFNAEIDTCIPSPVPSEVGTRYCAKNYVQRSGNYVLSLDGNDDYLDISTLAPKMANDSSYSIEFRVKIDITSQLDTESSHRKTILAVTAAGSSYKRMQITANLDGSDKIKIEIWDNNGHKDTAYGLENNAWHHIAYSRDSDGYARFYIDGSLINDNHQPAHILSPDDIWSIGAQRTSSGSYYHLAGQIDEFRVWNTPRSVTEINNNKDLVLTGDEEGLIAQLRFDDYAYGTAYAEGKRYFMLDNVGTTHVDDMALQLDGEDDYLDISPVADDLASATDWVFEGWFHIDITKQTLAGGHVLLGINRSATLSDTLNRNANVMHLFAEDDGSGAIQLKIYDGADNAVEFTSAAITNNTWHHIAYRYHNVSVGSGNGYLYIDGSIGPSHLANWVPLADDQWFIGQELDGTDPSNLLRGSVNEVRVWNKLRDSGTIFSQMNLRNLAADTANLVGYWTFDSDSSTGTTAADSSTTISNPGTLKNFGRELVLDGHDDFIDISSIAGEMTGSTSFKITLEGIVLDDFPSGTESDATMFSITRGDGDPMTNVLAIRATRIPRTINENKRHEIYVYEGNKHSMYYYDTSGRKDSHFSLQKNVPYTIIYERSDASSEAVLTVIDVPDDGINDPDISLASGISMKLQAPATPFELHPFDSWVAGAFNRSHLPGTPLSLSHFMAGEIGTLTVEKMGGGGTDKIGSWNCDLSPWIEATSMPMSFPAITIPDIPDMGNPAILHRGLPFMGLVQNTVKPIAFEEIIAAPEPFAPPDPQATPRQTVDLPSVAGPTEITYSWQKQIQLAVNVLPLSAAGDNYIAVWNGVGYTQAVQGTGSYWFDEGAQLKVGANPTSGDLSLSGYLNALGSFEAMQGQENPVQITLNELSSLTWNYEQTIYEEEVTVGMPVSFSTIPQAVLDNLSTDTEPQLATNQAGGVNAAQPYLWGAFEKKLYPVQGDTAFTLNWPTKSGSHIILNVTTRWPENPHYLHVAQTPPVVLDPSPDDSMAFKEIKYSDSGGRVNTQQEFEADFPGRSVLLYTTTDQGGSLPSKVSLNLDGVDDYADISPVANELGGDTTYTIEFWVNSDLTNTGYDALFSINNNTGGTVLYMNIGPGGMLRYYEKNGTGFTTQYGEIAQLTANTWHHVAYVRNGGSATFYVDGVARVPTPLFKTGYTTPPSYTPIHVLQADDLWSLGQVWNLDKTRYHFKGNLDEVRVWSTTRSEAEIQANKDLNLDGNEDGLVGYWQFDYTGFDKTQEANHGTLHNVDSATVWDTRPTQVKDTYLSFDGYDDYVDISGIADNMADVADFTFEFWMKGDLAHQKDPGQVFIFGVNTSGWDNVVLIGVLASKIIVYDSDTTIQSSPLADDTWYHVAYVRKDSIASLYIDGELAGPPISSTNQFRTTDKWSIGQEYDAGTSSDHFQGFIDEVRVWDTARTPGELVANMNVNLAAAEEPNLQGYWRFDDLYNGIVPDDTANVNNGTLVNMDVPACLIGKVVTASGDETKEKVAIRLVQTKKYSNVHSRTNAIIGTPITTPRHDPAVPHNGYVFWELGRYNANIHDRANLQGPIIPVNKYYGGDKENELMVVWYRRQENISWPYQAVTYDNDWPTTTPERIVIASRLGSEGRNRTGSDQDVFDPARHTDLAIYDQPNPMLPGYNPNEEHALLAPSIKHAVLGTAPPATPPEAVFALRNDLNIVNHNDLYTSDPYVLVQYFDNTVQDYRMRVFGVELSDPLADAENQGRGYDYIFRYPMEAGEPVVAPYPLNLVLGVNMPDQIFGENADPGKLCYWEDHKGQAWAVSGDSDPESDLYSYFYYPLQPGFWTNRDENGDGQVDAPGTIVPWLPDHNLGPVQVQYDVSWPAEVATLKAGETLTFSGGEYRADNTTAPGLPGVLAWAAGQVVYDDRNPDLSPATANRTDYSLRLVQALEERTVPLGLDDMPEGLQPAGGKVDVVNNRWYFKELHAGLKSRIFYDPLAGKLGIRGFVNGKTLGDGDLTGSPPSVYLLQPNILTAKERDTIKAMDGTDSSFFDNAVENLYRHSRDPEGDLADTYTAGLDSDSNPAMQLGPGLAVVTNPDLLDPTLDPALPESLLYVTLAENNHEALGSLPVALHIIKVDATDYFRGAIKTNFSDNVFDEKITLSHTADFGANPDSLIYQWCYHEDDGNTPADPPGANCSGGWSMFADPEGKSGLEMSEISLAGAGAALLVDNFFFTRYRHSNCDPGADPSCWSNWAGAADSRPPDTPAPGLGGYKPQLAEGWIKRVLNAVNPFEARISNFSNSDSPATYISMIQQAGTAYEGPVAFNPAKDVIENVGLIELYQTVLDRGRDLSIDLSQPVSTPGVTTALLLAASRISDFYTLLGNEAYNDALDPTIGIGSDSTEYGSLAPTIFSFMNQLPSLLDEELVLLRGRDEMGARPAYNRLLWNFTKSEGEVAYALNYNIKDANEDGFIDEADGRSFYPQGHGDAWGHYLTAVRGYYSLLNNPNFTWDSRSEHFGVEGVVIDVDYLDERKFAEAAAARAKVGSEIVNLTYRQKYVEDPAGQWQGYQDTDKERAWGVTGWGRRAFQGALFDWVTANAILPAEDSINEGIAKIDRTTVPELADIAAQARFVQQQYDNANTGLNPLGLATDVVPFDIDPSRLDPGKSTSATYFEQINERAMKALDNARLVFDHASDLNNRLRRAANSAEEFKLQVDDQDREYRNQLIEMFGTPYEGTIGSGKVYPAGYKGPDYYFYNYIDVNEIDSNIPESSELVTAYFEPLIDGENSLYFPNDLPVVFADPDGLSEDLPVDYPIGAGKYSFAAPPEWGTRRAPGEIQQALIELVKAETDLKLGLDDYGDLMSELKIAVEILEAGKCDGKELILDQALEKNDSLNDVIAGAQIFSDSMSMSVDIIGDTSDGIVDGLPKVVGLSNDVTSFGRSIARIGANTAKNIARGAQLTSDTLIGQYEKTREWEAGQADIKIQKADFLYEEQQLVKELEIQMGAEGDLRIEIFKRQEHMRQVSERYRAVLAKGLRLLEERQAYNKRVAAKTQGNRYQDMAFRLNRNDALSKYRSAFDLAARYTYLAAKAYDYETNLSSRDPASAQPLLTDIMKQRTLGQFMEGEPVIGRGGLADILARLTANYDVLKGQMGFNNPQSETSRFSLRKELFRIYGADDPQVNDSGLLDVDGDGVADIDIAESWRDVLAKHRVADLWEVPEFRMFCRPFAPQTAGPQPGIVIPFSTNVIFGKNFFGWPLGGGDHAYDPTNFATKVRSAGLWFENYDNGQLSETPRAYLVPAGNDFMLVPDSPDLETRVWSIVDQKVPVPLPAGDSDLNNPDWIPALDSLNGSMTKIRRYSSFRAHPDNGVPNLDEMSYDSRLVGRSVWNDRWMLIIPGGTFLYDADRGLDIFEETVSDIKLFFQTYAISGN